MKTVITTTIMTINAALCMIALAVAPSAMTPQDTVVILAIAVVSGILAIVSVFTININ